MNLKNLCKMLIFLFFNFIILFFICESLLGNIKNDFINQKNEINKNKFEKKFELNVVNFLENFFKNTKILSVEFFQSTVSKIPKNKVSGKLLMMIGEKEKKIVVDYFDKNNSRFILIDEIFVIFNKKTKSKKKYNLNEAIKKIPIIKIFSSNPDLLKNFEVKDFFVNNVNQVLISLREKNNKNIIITFLLEVKMEVKNLPKFKSEINKMSENNNFITNNFQFLGWIYDGIKIKFKKETININDLNIKNNKILKNPFND